MDKPSIRPDEQKLSLESVEHIERAGMVWIDALNASNQSLDPLAQTYHLHPLQIAECLQKSQIPQIEVEDTYIFLLLHFPHLVVSQNRIVTSQVGIFLGKDYLVTVHDDTTPSMRVLFDSCKTGLDKMSDLHTLGHILYMIIEKLLTDLTKLIYSVIEELDAIEAGVFDTKASDGLQIGQLRQKIMRLRRLVAAKNIVLDDLSSAMLKITGESLSREYAHNTKTTKKLSALLDEARETIEIYKDVDFTSSTEKTNEILAMLTLLFTLTIPATILGTFYGMNILLPGGITTGSWTFLGSYTLLKLIVAVSVGGALGMYLYFRSKKWF